MWPWTSLLCDARLGGDVRLHLFMDGSWIESAKLGGYVVVLLLEHGSHRAFFGAVCEQTHGNPDSFWEAEGPPALRNEQCALAAAVLWVFQSIPFLAVSEVIFHYDCLVAGKALSGDRAPDGPFMQRIRDLHNWLDRVTKAVLRYEHVKAHDGNPMNELADAIAKQAASGHRRGSAPPSEVIRLTTMEADLTWLAPSVDKSQREALQKAEALSWDPFRLAPDQLVPTTTTYVGRDTTSTTTFEMVVASLNVQGLSGKHRYLEEQFEEAGCHVVCLQETKGSAGVCASGAFLRLGTASDRHWGVGIWISRTLGLFTTEGRQIQIVEPDIFVVKESPRLLILELTVAGLHIVVFSGHCPHSGNRAEAAEFVEALKKALYPLRNAHLVVDGIDLNGRPPGSFETVTGDLVCGEVDETGKEAAAALHSLRMWLPSTFSQYHEGDSFTYRHPQGQRHRIDFVAQGGRAVIHQVCSAVKYGFDVGGAHDDHWPVVAEFRGTIPQAGQNTRIWRPKYDLAKIMAPAGKALVGAKMREYQPPFTSYVQGILERFFAQEPAGPRAEYIPESVWELRRAKLALKARSRHRADLWSSLVTRAFGQWRCSVDMGVARLVRRQGLLYQLVSTAIGIATAAIKRGIKEAKAVTCGGSRAAVGRTRQTSWATSKKIGLGGAKAKTAGRQLPALIDATGCPVRTRQDRDKLWLTHFGKQELGHIEKVSDFLEQEHSTVVQDQELQWAQTDLPSLAEIEAAIRSAPPRRAAGLDAIPAEVLKAAPGPMAAALQSLLVKSTLRLQQPLQWRGGLLYEAWKGSGQRSDPSAHRSLFVSSVVGKCFHKLTRRKIQSYVNEGLHEFHLGARRGQPVLYPAAYILSFLRRARGSKSSVAILFLDAEAAYYRICESSQRARLKATRPSSLSSGASAYHLRTSTF